MLESMAESLGYRKINWDIIQTPYVPAGLLEQIEAENLFKKAQLAMSKVFTDCGNKKDGIEQFGVEIEKRCEAVKNSEK